MFAGKAISAFFCVNKGPFHGYQLSLNHFSYCLWFPANIIVLLAVFCSKQTLYCPVSRTKKGSPCFKCLTFSSVLSCCIFFQIFSFSVLSSFLKYLSQFSANCISNKFNHLKPYFFLTSFSLKTFLFPFFISSLIFFILFAANPSSMSLILLKTP